MSIWVATKPVRRIIDDFRARFPNKNRAQDGTIGDDAHKLSTSSHNPDDTLGSRSEYTDVDGTPEVRAADVDARLNDPNGITMDDCIQSILRTPADRDRWMYIIFRRRVWRKRNGWRQEAHDDGGDHDLHAHFSGDPLQDENGAEFTSITRIGKTSEEDEDMGASFGPINLELRVTSLNIPPVQAGGADPRPAWLNFCNETFGVPYALRVWYTTGNEVWQPLPGTNAGLLKLRSGQRFSQELPVGTSCLSITRKAIDEAGKVVEPTPELQPYDEHLTCAIERGAVNR